MHSEKSKPRKTFTSSCKVGNSGDLSNHQVELPQFIEKFMEKLFYCSFQHIFEWFLSLTVNPSGNDRVNPQTKPDNIFDMSFFFFFVADHMQKSLIQLKTF
jgi:hypothetical protein